MSFNDALKVKVNEKVAEINDLVRMGWTQADAVAYARQTSTLGPKCWTEIMATVAR